jgi:hypothetical protein
MTVFDVFLAVLFLLAGAGVAGVVYHTMVGWKRPTDAVGWVSTAITALMTVPAVIGLCSWTLHAAYTPQPAEVRWEDLDVDPNAGFMARQVTWTALKTGWLKPEVKPGFFYSTAQFGSGDETVRLVYLPLNAQPKWRKY